jgi:superfamily II DNA or RNA helicase
MFDIHTENIDEVFYYIKCETALKKELRDYFSFKVPGAQYMPAYKNRWWDGTIKLYNILSSTLPRGLKTYLEKFCKDRGYSLNIKESKNPLCMTEEQLAHFYESLKVSVRKQAVCMHAHQQQAILHALNNHRSVIISPTGSGKSLIIYVLVRYLQKVLNTDRKILILVPTVGLVNQMEADFFDYSSQDKSWSCKKYIHKISAGQEKDTNKQVVVSTWQSIYKLPKVWFDQFDAIFFDECHQAKAESINFIGQKLAKAWFRIGTTGTLQQTQAHRLSIEGILGPAVQFIQTKNLMNKGLLAKLDVDCIILKYKDEEKQLVKKQRYADEIKWVVTHDQRNQFIKELALRTKGNTLILFNYVEIHGRPLASFIEAEAGNRKVYFISGKTDAEAREYIRRVIDKEKDAILVASYGTTSAGINIVNLDNIIFASPTKSVIRLLQSIGRGLRVSDRKKSLKVYDIVDDLSWKSHKNHVLKHFEERVKIYTKEKFDHKILSMPLPDPSKDK